MKFDKISIITATFNCVDEIEMSIQSVLEQDYPNIEYIVIDGASTDGTVDIIKKYSDKLSYWVSEPDNGLYYAMNKGIEVATGEWIYIYNAGGVFHSKNVLSSLMQNDFTGISAFFGYVYLVAEHEYKRNPIPFYLQKTSNKRPGYSHQALFVRASLCKKYPFDTSFKCCADFNQAVTIYKNGGIFKYIDIPVCNQPPAGFSAANRRVQLLENARINERQNTISFIFELLLFDIKKMIKRVLKKKFL